MNDTQKCSAKTRCKLHGGMSTGPTTDAGKAKASHPTHGIYATALNPEEVEAVTQADDTLANELVVARVQLRRAPQSWDTRSASIQRNCKSCSGRWTSGRAVTANTGFAVSHLAPIWSDATCLSQSIGKSDTPHCQ